MVSKVRHNFSEDLDGLWDRDVAPMADCLPSMAQAQSPVMALPKRKKKRKKVLIII